MGGSGRGASVVGSARYRSSHASEDAEVGIKVESPDITRGVDSDRAGIQDARGKGAAANCSAAAVEFTQAVLAVVGGPDVAGVVNGDAIHVVQGGVVAGVVSDAIELIEKLTGGSGEPEVS